MDAWVPKLQKAGIGTLGGANTTGRGQYHWGDNTTRRSGSDPHCWQDYPKETRGHRRVRMTQTVMPSVNSNVFLRQYQYCNKRKVRLTFLTRLFDRDHHRPRLFSQTLVPSVTRRVLLMTQF